MGLFGLRVKDSNPSNKVHSKLEAQFAHSDVSKTLTTDLSFSAYFLKFRFSDFQIWVQRLIYAVNVGTHKKNHGKQKPRKSRLLSSTKGEEDRIQL